MLLRVRAHLAEVRNLWSKSKPLCEPYWNLKKKYICIGTVWCFLWRFKNDASQKNSVLFRKSRLDKSIFHILWISSKARFQLPRFRFKSNGPKKAFQHHQFWSKYLLSHSFAHQSNSRLQSNEHLDKLKQSLDLSRWFASFSWSSYLSLRSDFSPTCSSDRIPLETEASNEAFIIKVLESLVIWFEKKRDCFPNVFFFRYNIEASISKPWIKFSPNEIIQRSIKNVLLKKIPLIKPVSKNSNILEKYFISAKKSKNYTFFVFGRF